MNYFNWPSGQSNVNSKSQHSTKSACHNGNVEIVSTEKYVLCGGGLTRNGGWRKMDDGPDLAVGPKSVMTLPQSTLPISSLPDEHIALPWPDRRPPKIDPDFWKELAEQVLTSEDLHQLLFQCQGGHGRTGTAACCFLAHALKNDWETVSDAVQWVRSRYCTSAVETTSQVQYIADATGLEYDAEAIFPSKSESSKAANAVVKTSANGNGSNEGETTITLDEPYDDIQVSAVQTKLGGKPTFVRIDPMLEMFAKIENIAMIETSRGMTLNFPTGETVVCNTYKRVVRNLADYFSEYRPDFLEAMENVTIMISADAQLPSYHSIRDYADIDTSEFRDYQ